MEPFCVRGGWPTCEQAGRPQLTSVALTEVAPTTHAGRRQGGTQRGPCIESIVILWSYLWKQILRDSQQIHWIGASGRKAQPQALWVILGIVRFGKH